MRFKIHHIDPVDSTNNYAFEFCKKAKVEEGIVYVASEQYAGKGHNQNHWESEKGKNITLSLVIHPDFIEPAKQFLITQCISLAITDLLKTLVNKSDVKIKWPNDIYIRDSKVCGILIQNSIVGDKIDYVKVKTFNPYTGFPINVILAKERLNAYFPDKDKDLLFEEYKAGDKHIPFKVIGEHKGFELTGTCYEQLFPWIKPGSYCQPGKTWVFWWSGPAPAGWKR